MADPYRDEFYSPEYDDPGSAPAPAPASAWTPAELDAARAYFGDFISQHGLSSWGDVNDPLRAYQQQRQAGLDDAAARAAALHTLGWDDSARWPTAPATTTGPAPTPAPGPTTTGGSLTTPFTQKFTAPAPVDLGGPAGIPYVPSTPSLTAPAFPTIPRFQAPTVEQALASPGYQFRVQQGTEGLQNWAAARGTLNDSSTAKALIDYNQSAASQEYQNVWNRDFNAYQSDVQTQYLDPWMANYQGWLAGTVNPTMTAYSTQAAAGQHQNDLNYGNAWNAWLQDWNIFRDQRDSTFNKQLTAAML